MEQKEINNQKPFAAAAFPPKRNWFPFYAEIEGREPEDALVRRIDKKLAGHTCPTGDEWRGYIATARATPGVDNWMLYAAGIAISPKLKALPSTPARQSPGEIANEAATQAALRNDAANRAPIGYERVQPPKPIIPQPGPRLLERVALRRTGT